jgi:hypothetical protein
MRFVVLMNRFQSSANAAGGRQTNFQQSDTYFFGIDAVMERL